MTFKENATGFQHIGIPTNSLADTIDFYSKIGFEIALRTENKEAGEQVAFLKLGNLIIETYENKAAVMKTGAIDHFTIDVKDIESAYSYICEIGLNNQNDTIHFLPFWDNGVKYFKIQGVNCEVIEFAQYL